MLKMHECDHVCGLDKVNYQIVCHLYYSILINGTQFDVIVIGPAVRSRVGVSWGIVSINRVFVMLGV